MIVNSSMIFAISSSYIRLKYSRYSVVGSLFSSLGYAWAEYKYSFAIVIKDSKCFSLAINFCEHLSLFLKPHLLFENSFLFSFMKNN